MTDPPSAPRVLACERCGASLECTAGTGNPCWCGRESFRLPMPLPAGIGPFADCLCPECLRAVAAELASQRENAREVSRATPARRTASSMPSR